MSWAQPESSAQKTPTVQSTHIHSHEEANTHALASTLTLSSETHSICQVRHSCNTYTKQMSCLSCFRQAAAWAASREEKANTPWFHCVCCAAESSANFFSNSNKRASSSAFLSCAAESSAFALVAEESSLPSGLEQTLGRWPKEGRGLLFSSYKASSSMVPSVHGKKAIFEKGERLLSLPSVFVKTGAIILGWGCWGFCCTTGGCG